MNADDLISLAYEQPAVLIGVIGILVAFFAWRIERHRPRLAHGLANAGYLAMAFAGMAAVLGLAGKATHSEAIMLLDRKPAVEVSGGQTVIPKSPDGHFWARATVNGYEQQFLIDTGATITALSRRTANEAGYAPDEGRPPVTVNTANGTMIATMGTVDDFRFGSIRARDLKVIVPRDLDDDTNVIGMNLLSELASWRVEGDRLILVPKVDPAA